MPMFFMSTRRRTDREKEVDGGRRDFDGSERLAIRQRFARQRAEPGMSAGETKRPGYFTRDIKKYTSEEKGFAPTSSR